MADFVEMNLDRLGRMRLEAERVEQARRGIHSHYIDRASKHRGPHRKRGADSRLADAAGAQADDETFREQVDRLATRGLLRMGIRLHGPSSFASSTRASFSSSPRLMAGVNIIGRLIVGRPASANRGATSAALSCAQFRRTARRAWPPSGLSAASSDVSKSKSGTQLTIAATVTTPSLPRIV